MRSVLAFVLVLGSLLAVGSVQAQHRVTFTSEPGPLEVFVDAEPVCRTPCEHLLDPGSYHLSFAQTHADTSRRSEHSRRPHLSDARHEYGVIDVNRAINLRVEWVDRSELRLMGDIVLIVGVTLGALLAGTVFASYHGDDDALLGLGSSGVVLAGLSLAVGIPLSVFEDSVHVR